MRYYDEARKERAIRRKASWITFLVFTFFMSGMAVMFVDQPEQYIPDTVKEWLDTEPEKEEAPKKRAQAQNRHPNYGSYLKQTV